MDRLLPAVFIAVLSSITVPAHALIDMRNANFSDTWVDLEVPSSAYNLKVQRTYNSRSLFNGMFGFGWCSDFETNLEITSEGNLKLTACGDGMEMIYSPGHVGSKDVDSTVQQIVSKLKAQNPSATSQYLKDISNLVRTDRRVREKYVEDLGIKTNLQKSGTFLANGIGPDSIESKDNFYLRRLPGGETEKFDSKGHLVQVSDKNGNYIQFNYSADGLKEVSDNNGNKLTFSYYTNKKVKKIVGPNGLQAEFAFKNLNDLEKVENAWGNAYTYAYDDLHNLTKINFPDKTTKILTYDTNKDWVLSFKDRDNCKEEYKYEMSKDDPKNHYWSTIVKKCDNKVTAQARYEFWFKLNKDKTDKFLARALIKTNDDTQDITYNEILGKPATISKNGKITYYDYDEKTGLLKMKREHNRTVAFEYDKACKKVEKVSEGKQHTSFLYDNKCNLISAKNTKGQTVALKYDAQGRIATMVDQAKRQVNITYEERFGKPKSVERPGLGTLKVTYKPNGEIQKVDSPAGPTVAVQVAGAFNNLLEIVEPAGVELGL